MKITESKLRKLIRQELKEMRTLDPFRTSPAIQAVADYIGEDLEGMSEEQRRRLNAQADKVGAKTAWTSVPITSELVDNVLGDVDSLHDFIMNGPPKPMQRGPARGYGTEGGEDHPIARYYAEKGTGGYTGD